MKQWLKYQWLMGCGAALTVGCIVVDDSQNTATGGSPATGGRSSAAVGSAGTESTSTGGRGTAGAEQTSETTAGAAGQSSTSSQAGNSQAGNGTAGAGAASQAGTDAGVGGSLAEGGAGGATPLGKTDFVSLERGKVVLGAPPTSSDDYDGAQITGLEGPETVTNGGTFTLTVTLPDTTGEQTFVVAIDGDNGYFVTDASNDDGSFEIALTLNADLEARSIKVSVAPMDDDGDVGDFSSIDLDLLQSGTGDVKVTLAFDQDNDLDLHVIEPNGTRISYSAPQSATGGELDLDSNAGCVIDGTNIENIFWPPGDAPAGEYVVEVQYYEACFAETVNYTVTINVGDEVSTESGSFEPEEALLAGGGDSRREVARFTVD